MTVNKYVHLVQIKYIQVANFVWLKYKVTAKVMAKRNDFH